MSEFPGFGDRLPYENEEQLYEHKGYKVTMAMRDASDIICRVNMDEDPAEKYGDLWKRIQRRGSYPDKKDKMYVALDELVEATWRANPQLDPGETESMVEKRSRKEATAELLNHVIYVTVMDGSFGKMPADLTTDLQFEGMARGRSTV